MDADAANGTNNPAADNDQSNVTAPSATAQSNVTSPSQTAQSNLTATDTDSPSYIIDNSLPQSSLTSDDGPPNRIIEDHDDNPTSTDLANQVSKTAAAEVLLEQPMVDTDELIEKLAGLLIITGTTL